MDLVYFILCAYGLTQILVYSTLLKRIRPKHHFFRCTMCIGFWVGAFLFGINAYTDLFTFEYNLVDMFLLGCIGSGTSYVLCQVFGDNGIKVERRD